MPLWENNQYLLHHHVRLYPLNPHDSANTLWKDPVMLPQFTHTCDLFRCIDATSSLPIPLEGCQPQVTWPGRKNLGDFWDPSLVRRTFLLLLLAHAMSNMIDGLIYCNWKPAVGQAGFASKCIDPVQKHRLYWEKQHMCIDNVNFKTALKWR